MAADNARLSETLWNRTYIGLLVAQFLAAFNDQAIHASAMFFAINTQSLSEAQAISLMPILFYAPWALFCTLAGYFADRFSKRNSLVFWKVAEVAITAVALAGFYIGTEGGQPGTGAWIVLSTVFLMGTHSAFFVPAKYGVMPEILPPHLLSRGNGILESLSFLAVILGTVTGGVLSYLFQRQEWIIGVILLGLALVGAVASLMIHRMPAANKDLKFPPYLYAPLYRNLRTLLTARPLCFAVVGIAFFTFVVAFMRATVYMLGESQNPRWDELKTSVVVGTVAFGIGLGSPLAGWLSGKKVELGLIPFGGLGMVVGCVCAAVFTGSVPGLMASTVLIGFSTGFFLVPLFTLLQYRAPKSSKGDMIATSNFINVVGAITASLLFALVVLAAKKTGLVPLAEARDGYAAGVLEKVEANHGRPVGFTLRAADGKEAEFGRHPRELDTPSFNLYRHVFGVRPSHAAIDIDRDVRTGDAVVVSRFVIGGVEHLDVRREGSRLEPDYNQEDLPKYLFLGAGLLTLIVLLILTVIIPDLPRRAWLVLWAPFTKPIEYEGLEKVPGKGAVLLRVAGGDRRMIVAMRRAIDRMILPIDGVPVNAPIAERLMRAGHIVRIDEGPEADAFAAVLAAKFELKQICVTGDEVIQHLRVKFAEIS